MSDDFDGQCIRCRRVFVMSPQPGLCHTCARVVFSNPRAEEIRRVRELLRRLEASA